MASWWEEIVWAIEVTEIGQPRLVYWDKYSNSPIPMSWELSGDPIQLAEALKNHLRVLRDLLLLPGSPDLDRLDALVAGALQTGTLNDLVATDVPAAIDVSRADINNRLGSLGTAIMGMLMPLLVGNELRPFEFWLDLDKLPRNAGGSGVLPSPFSVPDFPMRGLANVWLGYAGIPDTGEWVSLDGLLIRDVGGILMLLSFTYGKGPLNAIGILLSVCAETLRTLAGSGRPFKMEVCWNRRDGRLGFRGTLSFEPDLKDLYKNARDMIPDFVGALLAAPGNTMQLVRDLLHAPEHLFADNPDDLRGLFETLVAAIARWAKIGAAQAETAGRGIAAWLEDGLAAGQPTLPLANPLLPEAIRHLDTSEIPRALWLFARNVGALLATGDPRLDALGETIFKHIHLNKRQALAWLKAHDSDPMRERTSQWLSDHWDAVTCAFTEAAEAIKEIIDRLGGAAKEGPVIKQLLALFAAADAIGTEATDILNPIRLLDRAKDLEEVATGGYAEVWRKMYREAERRHVDMNELLKGS